MSIAVIGDVVGSRRHPDRTLLQEVLVAAFARIDQQVAAIQPFTMTIGDEFQGVFSSLEEAFTATFIAQVATVGTTGLRFGVGVGEVVRLGDAGPFQQDGSAWWRAREALERVRSAERSHGTPMRWATGLEQPVEARSAIDQGYLLLRDHIVGDMDRVDADIVQGLMNGDTQTTIAARIGIDKGAVSRRVGRHGLSALLWSLPR